MLKTLDFRDIRKRLAEAFDHRVRIITAGLNLDELRAVLRGDPPTEKPNPRYRVHTTSFLFHIRPRYYEKGSTIFTHTFRLGFFTTFFFIVESITGVILMIYYTPSPAEAYSSILNLMSNVPFGKMLRDVHRLGAEAMVIFTALHMLRTFLTGSYKKDRSFTWLTGVVLLGITLFLSFSGYLLPWDQLAYWAVTIGTSMAEAAPMFGEQANLLEDFGEAARHFLRIRDLAPTATIRSGAEYDAAVALMKLEDVTAFFRRGVLPSVTGLGTP